MYSPEMAEYGKSVIDPKLERLFREEVWPPGFPQIPGLQTTFTEDGGDFVDSMTTSFEKNQGCALNSMAMANGLLHCDKLITNKKIPSPIRAGGVLL